MHFDAKAPLPDDTVNVSKTHPLAEAGTLVLGLVAIVIAVMLLIVFFVDIAISFVSPKNEAKVFASWNVSGLLFDDNEVNQQTDTQLRVQTLVEALSAHWQDAPYTFEVNIWDTEELNAFALPGGTIVVTQGLLDKVQSENELAFVLGHEIGHFKNRDHLKGLGRGVALSMVMATVFNGQVSTHALTTLSLNSFSRKQEHNADKVGLELMHEHYGHVTDSTAFFEKLSAERGNHERYAYLTTHPASSERIKRIQKMAQDQQWSIAGESLAWDASSTAP